MRYVMVVMALIVAAGLAGLWWMEPAAPLTEASYGKAAIGGPFALKDHRGKSFTNADLKGHYSLVYFGFTHCPDICPAGLSTITNALEALGDKAERITPVFVTVDPERDTREVMADYVSHFHPSLIGLTGTNEQIKQIAAAYKVYYSKAEQKDSAVGYVVDHSGYMYLMGPDGEYLAHFPHDIAHQTLADSLATFLKP